MHSSEAWSWEESVPEEESVVVLEELVSFRRIASELSGEVF